MLTAYRRRDESLPFVGYNLHHEQRRGYCLAEALVDILVGDFMKKWHCNWLKKHRVDMKELATVCSSDTGAWNGLKFGHDHRSTTLPEWCRHRCIFYPLHRNVHILVESYHGMDGTTAR